MPSILGGDGRRIQLDLTPSADASTAMRLLDKAAKIVQAEWGEVRQEIMPHGPGGRAKKRDFTWLKMAAYVIIVECIEQELDHLFEARVRKHRTYPRGRQGRDNVFRLGLLALLAEDRDALREGERGRMSMELEFAYRHYVPPAFLLGFLAQANKAQWKRSSSGLEILPEFREWVIEQRSKPDPDEGRYDYPQDIENEVDERQRARASMVDDDDDDDLELISRINCEHGVKQ